MIGYELIGQGPEKVVVLHGWFGDHTVWAPIFPFIDQKKFSFAFLDYRGYGASRSMPGEHSIQQISTDAIELADHLGWSTFSVVGHSMGGQAAQRVAVDAPLRVQALVGVTPVPAAGMRMPLEAEAMFAAVADSDDAGEQILRLSTGDRLKPEVLKHIMQSTRQTTERQAVRSYGQAFIHTNFAEEAKSIKVPILILIGEHDGGVTEALARNVFPSLYSHVEIEVVGNSGHYPMLETPVWLITRIENFLSRCASARLHTMLSDHH